MNDLTKEKKQKLTQLLEKEANNNCKELLDDLNESLEAMNFKAISEDEFFRTRTGFIVVFLIKQIAAISAACTFNSDYSETRANELNYNEEAWENGSLGESEEHAKPMKKDYKVSLDEWVEENDLGKLEKAIETHLDFATRENMTRMIMISIRDILSGKTVKDL